MLLKYILLFFEILKYFKVFFFFNVIRKKVILLDNENYIKSFKV